MSKKTIWAIDPLHSEVLFKVKHLVISTLTGSFNKFDGYASTQSEDFNNAAVHFTMDVKSINTNQPQRDQHLQNEDFFSADLYPTITFDSTSFVKKAGSDYKMLGNLTMRGVTKQVELNVEYGGSENDGHGNMKHGFEVTGIINRKEFGMTWNKLTEAGGLGLSEDIKLIANVQVSKKVEEAVEVK